MYQIKRVDLISFGKIGSIVFGVVLFLIGVFLAVLTLLVSQKIPSLELDLMVAGGISLAFTALLTASGVIVGFIAGVLIALIYNLLSRLVGGLRLEIVYINKKEEKGKEIIH